MDPFQVNALRNFYTKLRGGDERALTRRMLDELGVTLQCHLPDLERVPKTGPAVIARHRDEHGFRVDLDSR